MKVDSLPSVFAQYTGKVEYIQQVSPTEWSSTCPSCKGTVHEDRSWPDRCRWFTSGKNLGWCRVCGKLFWPDQAPDYKPPTTEQVEQWRQEQIKVESERKRSTERALDNLRISKVWERYHSNMGMVGREYWRKRGIHDEYQNWWKLGFIDEYLLRHKEETYLTQSATIPIFGAGWAPLNIKHRLCQPPDGIGKYKYEVYGQPQPLFLSNPNNVLDGVIYVIEGEIKAMSVFQLLADEKALVVGLPGCTPSAEAIAPITQADRIILVFDPGAELAAQALAITLGVKRCRILIPPVKIDDGILAIKPTKQELGRMLNSMAVPAEAM